MFVAKNRQHKYGTSPPSALQTQIENREYWIID
jgi:hypothetical protein